MSQTPEKNYDSTIMRIAGNLLSGVMSNSQASQWTYVSDGAVEHAVEMARAIVAETLRTSARERKGRE